MIATKFEKNGKRQMAFMATVEIMNISCAINSFVSVYLQALHFFLYTVTMELSQVFPKIRVSLACKIAHKV